MLMIYINCLYCASTKIVDEVGRMLFARTLCEWAFLSSYCSSLTVLNFMFENYERRMATLLDHPPSVFNPSTYFNF